jgi:hypothetical protein
MSPGDGGQRQADAAGQDVGAAQGLRRRLPAAERGGLERELVGSGDAAVAREDRQAARDERGAEGMGGRGHRGGIGGAVHLPVEQGHGEGGGFRRVEVRGHAGEGDGVEPLRELGVVGDDQAGGRAAERLVGAHGHRMRALGERLLPGAAGDHARHVGGVVEDARPHRVGDGADLAHRVRREVQAAADGDELRPQAQGVAAQRVEIDGVARGIDRGGTGDEAVEPGGARGVVGDVAADLGRRRDDRVAGPGAGHEDVEIGHGAGGHADLGEAGAEDPGGELGGDDLDLLDGLEPHLVLVAGPAERGTRAEPAASIASAFGFMVLVAGLRLTQSRSWMRRFSATSRPRAAAVASASSAAVRAAIACTRASQGAGTQGRGARLVIGDPSHRIGRSFELLIPFAGMCQTGEDFREAGGLREKGRMVGGEADHVAVRPVRGHALLLLGRDGAVFGADYVAARQARAARGQADRRLLRGAGLGRRRGSAKATASGGQSW